MMNLPALSAAAYPHRRSLMSDLIQAAKGTIAGKPGALRQKAKSLEAIATERYEYAVQVKIGAKWLFLGRGVGEHNLPKTRTGLRRKRKRKAMQRSAPKPHPE